MTREEAKNIISQMIKDEEGFLSDNIVEAHKMSIKALEQESNRDMEEIAEIMKSDADAETKCKMISYILTAKPNYFELSQESMREFAEESKTYLRSIDKMYKPAVFYVFNEPYNDAISREDVEECKELMTDINGDTVYAVRMSDIRQLPSVQPSRKGHWIGIDEEPHEDYECDKCGYVCSTFTANIKPSDEYKYCPNCGAEMESDK